jgi:hypothetical protein
MDKPAITLGCQKGSRTQQIKVTIKESESQLYDFQLESSIRQKRPANLDRMEHHPGMGNP